MTTPQDNRDEDYPEPADLGDDQDLHAPADLVELHEILAWNEGQSDG